MNLINAGSLEAIIPLVAGVFATIVGFKKSYDNPKWKFFRKFKWIGPFLIFFSVFLFVQGVSSNVDLNAVVKGMKKKINLPMAIDGDTRLDDIKVLNKKEIGYFMTLTNLSQSSVQLKEIMQALKSSLLNNSCGNQSYLNFFKEGVTVTMVYYTNDNQEAMKLSMPPSTCSKNSN